MSATVDRERSPEGALALQTVDDSPKASAADAVDSSDLPGSEAEPAPRERVPSLITDLGSSMMTQVLVVLGNLLTLRLAASFMTPDQVGELALGRRVLVLLTPFLLLGLGVGIPRTLGNLHGNRRLSNATAAAGWLFGVSSALLAAGVILLAPGELSKVFFGDTSRADLVKPLVIMILGQQAFMLTFAVFRGRLEIQRANILQVLHAACIPVTVVLLVGREGAVHTLWGIGTGTTALAAVSCMFLFWSLGRDFTLKESRTGLVTLIRYGFPRVPGDLANAGLYALGPLLAAHALDLRAAGTLAIGMHLVTVTAAAFSPLGLVLLPRLSRTLAESGDDRVRQTLPTAVAIVCFASAFLVLLGTAFGNVWLSWVLSPEFRIVASGMACVALAAGANVVVVVLRSWNDAAYFRPVNAINAAIALAIQAGLWVAFQRMAVDPFIAICLAIALSFVAQAILTLWTITRRFHVQASAISWLRWVGLQAGTGLGIYMFSSLMAPRIPHGIVVAQILSVGWWTLLLKLLGVGYFESLGRRFLEARRSTSSPADRRPQPAGQEIHLGPRSE